MLSKSHDVRRYLDVEVYTDLRHNISADDAGFCCEHPSEHGASRPVTRLLSSKLSDGSDVGLRFGEATRSVIFLTSYRTVVSHFVVSTQNSRHQTAHELPKITANRRGLSDP